MDRIGIAASKIAKGNIVLYNACVFFLIFLFALFIFIVGGAAIMIALMVVGYVVNGFLPHDFLKEWSPVVLISMSSLAAVVGVFSVIALIKNFKIKFLSSDQD